MLVRFVGILSFALLGKLRKISVNIRKLTKVGESWGKCDKKSLYLCGVFQRNTFAVTRLDLNLLFTMKCKKIAALIQ